MSCFATQKRTLDFRPYVGPIYDAILTRLANQDQDQVGHTAVDDSENVGVSISQQFYYFLARKSRNVLYLV